MEMNQNEKTTLLFVHLISSFKTSAMQQLGKVANPITGKLERDLPQASMTIDMLDMINAKCQGNLTEEEDKFLQHTVSELKLNYVDEIGRKEPPEETAADDQADPNEAVTTENEGTDTSGEDSES